MKITGEPLLPWLNEALDLSYKRNQLIATNLANIDTPDYMPKDLEFENHLKFLLTEDPQTSSTPRPDAYDRPGPEIGLDGNRVDMEQEMMAQAANKLLYEMVSQIVQKKLALIRYSIDEGGRG
jgi:flagellar basal-body rod protein FlgB